MPVYVPEPLKQGRHGAANGEPVRIGRRNYALVQLLARRHGSEALAEALRASHGLELPPPGRSAGRPGLWALWLQPGGWLIQAASRDDLAAGLIAAVGPAGAVVDQSHGRAVFTLEGMQARAVLARLCRLDLHPRLFGPGQVAATPLGGLGALLHQVSNATAPDLPTCELPAYEMIVPASYARAFGRMLAQAAAPVGYEVA